jgi:hypothetical protein
MNLTKHPLAMLLGTANVVPNIPKVNELVESLHSSKFSIFDKILAEIIQQRAFLYAMTRVCVSKAIHRANAHRSIYGTTSLRKKLAVESLLRRRWRNCQHDYESSECRQAHHRAKCHLEFSSSSSGWRNRFRDRQSLPPKFIDSR